MVEGAGSVLDSVYKSRLPFSWGLRRLFCLCEDPCAHHRGCWLNPQCPGSSWRDRQECAPKTRDFAGGSGCGREDAQMGSGDTRPAWPPLDSPNADA